MTDGTRLQITKKLGPFFINLNIESTKTLMPRKWFDRIKMSKPKYVYKDIHIEEEKDWVIWSTGLCNDYNSNLLLIAEECLNNNVSFESLTECSIKPLGKEPSIGRIAEVWRRDIGSPFIPYDGKARKKNH